MFRTIIIDHDQSEALIGNDKVRGVTLTGSDKAGVIVGQQAAKAIKKSCIRARFKRCIYRIRRCRY
ncbi:hypothetical protein [Psychrobacter sp. JCM 18901]|uniref:hypothetical protein n=1 Tax=Psychrobacter sp. JCM 18901 TaxID=1298609 RepID=UPI0021C43F7B|nr:hypothetical protein [Psychrobacter sp. JCM 18901]